MFQAVKDGLLLLKNPQSYFSKKNQKSLEEVVKHYLQLLISVGILAGIVALLFSLGKTFYYDLALNVDVQYGRMFNYLLGRIAGIAFFYVFAGTFFMFILSIILAIFIRIKYGQLLRLLMLSATPLLLFAWLPFSPVFLFVWSIFIFCIALKEARNIKVKKDSIAQRD